MSLLYLRNYNAFISSKLLKYSHGKSEVGPLWQANEKINKLLLPKSKLEMSTLWKMLPVKEAQQIKTIKCPQIPLQVDLNSQIQKSHLLIKSDPSFMPLSHILFGLYYQTSEYDFQTLNSASIILDSYASIIHDLEFGGKWFKLAMHDRKKQLENKPQ